MDAKPIKDLLDAVTVNASSGRAFQFKQQTDTGRTSLSLYANGAAVGATTVEAAITASISSGVAAVTTGVSYTIPTGKTFRILYISFNATGNAVGAVATNLFSLRYNAAGAVVVGSTPILLQRTLVNSAANLDFKQTELQLTQGFDIVGDGVASIGVTVNATYAAGAPTVGMSIVGFLYTS